MLLNSLLVFALSPFSHFPILQPINEGLNWLKRVRKYKTIISILGCTNTIVSFTNGKHTFPSGQVCRVWVSVTIRIVPYVSHTESPTLCKTRILHACEISQTYGDMIPLSNYFETNFKYFPFHVAWVELCLFQPEINISNLLVRCLTPLLYWFPTYHTCPHCTLCSPLAWATFRSFWATTHVSK